MKGFSTKIEEDTLENTNFREVLYTAKHSQLVVMSLLPHEDIGAEVHDVDQFIRCEQGAGTAIMDGVGYDMSAGLAVLVPAGIQHNITNTSDTEPMKLYTLYAPPHHRDGVIHKTKGDAEADTEHYEGVISEAL
jgi:mannose-6-phosphate isomerase-like protein (cupin superfamily)